MHAIGRRLEAWYRRSPALASARVLEVARMEGGFESDLVDFRLAGAPGAAAVRLVLRIPLGADAAARAQREGRVMRRLLAMGFPVPAVLAVETADFALGAPFLVMEWVDGQTLDAVTSASPPAENQRLLELACERLLELHRLDWRPFVADLPLAADPEAAAAAELRGTRVRIEALGLRGFEPVLGWLDERRGRVRWDGLSLVHGDYHPNNLLLGADGVLTVIDWGGARILDPRFDLALTVVLSCTHGNLPTRERLLRAYGERAGRPLEDVDFFEVAACTERLVTLAAGVTGQGSVPGLAPEAARDLAVRDGHAHQVYALLRAHSGVRLPGVERMLAAIGGAPAVPAFKSPGGAPRR